MATSPRAEEVAKEDTETTAPQPMETRGTHDTDPAMAEAEESHVGVEADTTVMRDLSCFDDPEPATMCLARTMDGWLRPWLEEAALIARLGPPEEKSEKWFQGYDALYHQAWSYGSRGISFELNAEDENSPMTMHLIRVTAPCSFTTPERIGIGSSEALARSIYEAKANPDYSDKNRIVLGDIYFGTMIFFEGRKVSAILVGNIHE